MIVPPPTHNAPLRLMVSHSDNTLALANLTAVTTTPLNTTYPCDLKVSLVADIMIIPELANLPSSRKLTLANRYVQLPGHFRADGSDMS